MPTPDINTETLTNNPTMAIISFTIAMLSALLSITTEQIDFYTLVALRMISIIAFAGSFIAQWTKIKEQLKRWFNLK